MKGGVIDQTNWKAPLNRRDRGLESGKACVIAGKHEHSAGSDRQGEHLVSRSVDAEQQFPSARRAGQGRHANSSVMKG